MSSVVGFDVGNDNLVAATARQRGIDVLLNAESKRESPALVSFDRNARLLGPTAPPLGPTTISQIKRLVGTNPSDNDLRRLPFTISPSPNGGREPLVHVHHLGQDLAYTPTQLLGMLLAHLKQLAETNLEAPVSDCVLGIPCYFTQAQRRAYLDAAAVAGLRPLRLMHDLTATALGYGIYKTDFTGTSPVHVAFVDVGHCDTQVAVVAFEANGLRVLAHSFDANLGGRDFDEVLFEHFAQEFKERYKIDVKSSVKASMRLRMACEKVKKVLSANAEAPLNIECLMDEMDVKGMIKREEFEKLCMDLLERIAEPCRRAVADSGVELDSIQSVELVGSGSRVPAIARVLTGFFGREPSRKLNASECVARGCALQCAMLSPTFRVREYEVQDAIPFSIGFTTKEGPISTMSGNVLFRRGQPFPSVKILSMHRKSTFMLEAFYSDETELLPGTATTIGTFQIGPFQAQSEKSKVKVRVRLNLHGIVFVESASLIEGESSDQITSDGADSMEIDTDADMMVDNVGHTEPGLIPSTVDKTQSAKATRRQDLPILESIYGAMSKQELLEAQEQEQKLAYQDKLMEQTKERKNALEAYVYGIRNKLFERYRSFASDSEREGIASNLQQTEDWLYEDGDDETVHVYNSKLEELKKLIDPIENRCKDEEARAQATRELLKCIVDHRMAVKSLSTYERDAVNNECSKAEQWLREKSQLQESLPKNVDPVLWSHEIKKRTEELDMTCRNILRHKGSPARTEESKGSDHSSSPNDAHMD